MDPTRLALGSAGGLLAGFGVLRLLTDVPASDLVALGVWLAAALLIHDLVVAPLTVGTGVVLARLPARGRRHVQAGLVAGALVTVVAVPLILREDTQPAAESILMRDYSTGLALLLGLVAAVSLLAYVGRVVRDASRRD